MTNKITKAIYSKYSFELSHVDISTLEFEQTGFVWSIHPNTLCVAMAKQYFQTAIKNPNISIIISPKDFGYQTDKMIIICEKADEFFHEVHNHLQEFGDISHRISSLATLSPFSHIEEGVVIEDGVVIEAGSYIGKGSIIKRNSYIGVNVMIGSQGMLPKYIQGSKVHLKHYGGVIIQEGCYLHAGTNVSKALFSKDHTSIGKHCHLGIQVNIAHDSSVGECSDISANSVISGRAKIGRNVWIGANCTISNWVTIGNNAKVRLGSTVIHDVDEGEDVSGNFAEPHRQRLYDYAKKQLKNN